MVIKALPEVTGINPSSGPAEGGTTVTITGKCFGDATGVKFGSVKAPDMHVDSDTQITAISPRGSGLVDITVVTADGASKVNEHNVFTYHAATSSPSSDGAIDSSLGSQLVSSLLSTLHTANSADALEAQNIILRRVALEGNIVSSRVEPPRNITEIGGYINMLDALNQPEMRSQVLAGILGVAGPSQPLGWISNIQPLSLVSFNNDRPGGVAQPTIPLTFLVRSDFSGALSTALHYLHQRGCTLPLASRPVMTLPPSAPGAAPPADILFYLGRTLDFVAGTALVDPYSDPLALLRAKGSSDSFQIAARVVNPGSEPVDAASYEALKCNTQSCEHVTIADGFFVFVAPVLAKAGFYPESPLPEPQSLSSTRWTHFTNITGLVKSGTRLGDELSLLYPWSAITSSVFANMLDWVWDGTRFNAF